MNILYEDRSLIVCIKPVGVLSQADENGGESMITLLEAHCGCTVYPLHRLDREVGGVMAYAKTKQAAAKLSQAIAEHRFRKEYIALVHGCPAQADGELRDLLFKDSRKNKSFVVTRPRKGVKEALLEYRVLSTRTLHAETPLSAVLVLLHTGRTHQIRVQFASRKMPLVGDRKYGGRDSFDTIGLWSFRLRFEHPASGEALCFSALPSTPFNDFLPADATQIAFIG